MRTPKVLDAIMAAASQQDRYMGRDGLASAWGRRGSVSGPSPDSERGASPVLCHLDRVVCGTPCFFPPIRLAGVRLGLFCQFEFRFGGMASGSDAAMTPGGEGAHPTPTIRSLGTGKESFCARRWYDLRTKVERAFKSLPMMRVMVLDGRRPSYKPVSARQLIHQPINDNGYRLKADVSLTHRRLLTATLRAKPPSTSRRVSRKPAFAGPPLCSLSTRTWRRGLRRCTKSHPENQKSDS